MPPAAQLIDATKKYGSVEALKGVTIDIELGDVVAMLGPNGAGKTTSISLLLGLRKPTSGKALLFGLKPDDLNARSRVGVMLQESGIPTVLKVSELVDLFRSYYPKPMARGRAIAMAGLDGGRINIAACSLGGAQNALEKSLAYMKERKAFGKRLDEFQALQFRLADMATELEAARTFVWRAAAALDRKDADATMLCAMAKRFGTDVGFEVANQALQLHGGYGYLSEYGIEKNVRDLRVHQILEGTNEIMRLIVSRKLIEGVR